ncbi:MAG: hypothetical protein FJ279_01020, partial [Planctomycetes bacterium]|nr:hypothetical protein [Planctomycetota bacterium]
MQSGLWFKVFVIVVVILIALAACYPLQEKVVRVEDVTEINGIATKRDVVSKSWSLAWLPITTFERETILTDTEEKTGDVMSRKVLKRIEHVVKGKIKLGLDLRGGSELLYRVRVESKDDRAGITAEVIQILEKRIDPQGVMEYRIQEHGQKRILIQVPGATKVEIDRLKERITRLGKLEFRLATTDQGLLAAARKGQPVPGYYVHWVNKKRGYRGDLEGESWYLVGNRVEVTGERLRRVFPDAK